MNRTRILETYTWLVITGGVGVLLYCIYHVPVAQLDVKFLLLAILAILFSSRFSINIPNYSGHITVSDTFIFLVMLFYGVEAAVFLAAAEGVYSSLPYRQKRKTIAVNGAIMAISTFLSGAAVHGLFGPIPELPHSENLGSFLAAICTMALVQYIANSGLAAIFTAIKRNQSIYYTWSKY